MPHKKMLWTSALLIFAAVQVCDAENNAASQYGPTPAPTPSPYQSPTPAPPHSTTHMDWWENKEVKKGLIGGAAAAGLATFGGLGIAALIQANKQTTTPPTPAPTAPPTTQYIVYTTPWVRAREQADGDGESSISPILLGALILLGMCCCCGLVGLCFWLNSRTSKRSEKIRPPPPRPHLQREEVPLVPPTLPEPPPPAPMVDQSFEVPLFGPGPPAFETPLFSPGLLAPITSLTPSYQYAAPPAYEYVAPATTSPMIEYAAPATTTLAPRAEYVLPATEYSMPASMPTYTYEKVLSAATPSYRFGTNAAPSSYGFGSTLPATTNAAPSSYGFGSSLPTTTNAAQNFFAPGPYEFR